MLVIKTVIQVGVVYYLEFSLFLLEENGRAGGYSG